MTKRAVLVAALVLSWACGHRTAAGQARQSVAKLTDAVRGVNGTWTETQRVQAARNLGELGPKARAAATALSDAVRGVNGSYTEKLRVAAAYALGRVGGKAGYAPLND